MPETICLHGWDPKSGGQESHGTTVILSKYLLSLPYIVFVVLLKEVYAYISFVDKLDYRTEAGTMGFGPFE